MPRVLGFRNLYRQQYGILPWTRYDEWESIVSNKQGLRGLHELDVSRHQYDSDLRCGIQQ